ncbi:MAG: RluA family pseudouridine synthase [Candidatus Saccharibacteria bacterium]|nr:RluA family pseudouridine synthase [Candidatus Saccharibacteria bacterium]
MAKKFSKPELSRMINGDIVKKDTQVEEEKRRFDMVLLEKYPEYTRGTIQKFIKEGLASINGEVITKANYAVSAEEEENVSMVIPEITAEKNRPPVLYEDDNVIVFDKPAGMLSIKKGAYLDETAVEDFGEIVHRLDRDTSGVIIVAKNAETKSKLQKQFAERKTHKCYYALVVGHPKQPHAIINVPLARNLKKPTTFIADKDGREAITEYKVIASNDRFSLVELKPRTGRTHQLRIHMAHIGTPILGDPVYNPKSPKADRMYLHAYSLEITIPEGKRVTFTSLLPESFRDAVK